MSNKFLSLMLLFSLFTSLSQLFADEKKVPPPPSAKMKQPEMPPTPTTPVAALKPEVPSIASGEVLKVIDDGTSIQEKGVFTDGCYYGENESISDHAPVLYNEVGTWNIAGPISHFKITPDKNKPAPFFFNHKFFTDDQGYLIGRNGEKLGFLGTSEVVLLTKPTKPADIKSQLLKDKNAVLDKIDKASMEMLDKLVTGDDPNRNAKILTLNQLHLDAMAEANNEKEEKYPNLIDLLSIYERSYAATNDQFVRRMEFVGKKIKEFFTNNSNLNYMVLQEVPGITDKTIAGENIATLMQEFYQEKDPWTEAVKRVLALATLDKANIIHIDTDKLEALFAEAPERVADQDNNKLLRILTALKKKEMLALLELAKGNTAANADINDARRELEAALKKPGQLENLNIVFFKPKDKVETEVGKTKYKKNMIPDVALVSRLSAPPLTQEIADHDSRFAPYCSAMNKVCYVAAHMPFPDKDDELMMRCKDLKNLALKLNEKGYNTISVLGDFNTHASRIASVCKDVLPVANGEILLHTSAGAKGNNCGSNTGHLNPENIYIMIKYEFSEAIPAPPVAKEEPAQEKPLNEPIVPPASAVEPKKTAPAVTTDRPSRPKRWLKPPAKAKTPPRKPPAKF